MWNISKEFDFCFGHRVWSQTLDKKLSIDDKCKCRHLHGHQGKIVIHAKGDKLNNGMITDFNHFNWFKRFIDEELDHKFIIDKSDPLIDILIPHHRHHPIPWITKPAHHSVVNPNFFKTLDDQSFIELLESFVRVDFVPTSENISKWLYDYIYDIMGNVINSVEFFETPKTRSVYNE